MPQDIHIEARDGFALAATLFGQAASMKGTIIMNSATAVPRQFYRSFASYLAKAGFRVVTYDYRGIGGSRPASLRGFKARMRDWGLQDMQGVLDWAAETYPDDPIFIVGHSVGGQQMGMLEGTDRIKGMITTSAQSGYWGLQGGIEKLKVALSMFILFPVLSRLIGYFPWSKLASGEDLPKGVALEWARWCRSSHYLFGDTSLPELSRFPNFASPILAYSFSDDDWGTRESVDFLMAKYVNAPMDRRHVAPAEIGAKRIGHTRFYRKDCQPLWDDVLAWIDEQLRS